MTPDDFDFISKLVNERSGLVLTPDKAYLLESRLMPVARKRGMKGLEELISAIRLRSEEDVIRDVTEAMTTNESFFFRDIKPFDIFREHTLPELLEACAGKKSFRVWCAAASSGQEPYSLAMVIKELGSQLDGWRYEIVGTDISTEILDKAKAGTYSQFEVQRGLPVQLLMKYFEKADDQWRISEDLRKMVQYKEFNLLEDPKALGTFDVVFCRNVLIYFDQPTKGQVLERMSALMPSHGKLFLGGAETVLGVTDKFKPISGQRGVYGVADATDAKPAPAPAAAGAQAAAS